MQGLTEALEKGAQTNASRDLRSPRTLLLGFQICSDRDIVPNEHDLNMLGLNAYHDRFFFGLFP